MHFAGCFVLRWRHDVQSDVDFIGPCLRLGTVVNRRFRSGRKSLTESIETRKLTELKRVQTDSGPFPGAALLGYL
jgi:hypothetical protein